MLARALLGRWNSRLLDLFFPRRCLGCGREGRYFCAQCKVGLPWIGPPWCPRCGLHLPEGLPCSGCQGQRLSLDGIRSAFLYHDPIRGALIAFKYRGVRAIGEELAMLLAQRLAAEPIPADVLVPVPLFPSRKRERGYNQADVLSRVLSPLVGLPVVPDALVRTRNTAPQARLTSRAARHENLAGAFLAGPESVAGQRVLVVDDVCTTGTTLNGCADVLRTAGATAVWGLTVAREE